MAVIPVESHPFEPFLPAGAEVLMLGTFPPKPERWSMEFYYPNRINDFWRVMGLVFYDDRDRFWDAAARRFCLDDIKTFLTERRIALWDTAMRVRRLKDNASDKFLEIVESIDLRALLTSHPTLRAVVTTGEKASGVVAELAGVAVPKMRQGMECEIGGHRFTFYRMPSTSRAYPLALEKKAEAYRQMMHELNILNEL